MGNVNLPTPVFLAGGALCLLGGYVLGVVAGPDTPSRTLGEVASYDASTGELCLTGDEVDDQEGAEDGRLCGVWRRSSTSKTPAEGDEFRFVSILTEPPEGQQGNRTVMIYGDVVG